MEELKSKFTALLTRIQQTVAEQKALRLLMPSVLPMRRWKATEHAVTETGVTVQRAQEERFTKTDWAGASFRLIDEVAKWPDYQQFFEELAKAMGKDALGLGRSGRALQTVVHKVVKGDNCNPAELFAQLIQLVNDDPVLTWCDIDVFGIVVNGAKEVRFNAGDAIYTFRQLQLSDFEEPVLDLGSIESRMDSGQPGCILRAETKTTSAVGLQTYVSRVLTMLRLFQVCSVKFGRQGYNRANEFYFPFGINSTRELFQPGNHPISLTPDSADRLTKFWKAVWSKLPAGLNDYGPKETTPVFIAYERYCDSLFSPNPVERKIAFAIMGLEAIYLARDEAAENTYRLEMRAAKFLSKLGVQVSEARRHLKHGYRVRNMYVHGGHLSDDDKEKLKRKNMDPDAIANALLNYLRVSILHLIVSQSKEDFLKLLEESFIERAKDDELEALPVPEKEFV